MASLLSLVPLIIFFIMLSYGVFPLELNPWPDFCKAVIWIELNCWAQQLNWSEGWGFKPSIAKLPLLGPWAFIPISLPCTMAYTEGISAMYMRQITASSSNWTSPQQVDGAPLRGAVMVLKFEMNHQFLVVATPALLQGRAPQFMYVGNALVRSYCIKSTCKALRL